MFMNNSAMLYQVNRLLFRRCYNVFTANNQLTEKTIYPLKNRKLLKVSGPDASVFLQGLITNDMKHFEDGAKSMYAMFLNNKGRVLYDTLILKGNEEESFVIECDKTIAVLLQRHLKLYKLKRKVDIGDVSQEYKLWVYLSEPISTDIEEKPTRGISLYKDPRLIDLGHRILTKSDTKDEEIVKVIGDDVVLAPDDKGYKCLRYRLGVSEGAEDLPPGTSFPLEANCDYLHGVSFHKGCYIGQELTARVHHTGVVRKRIMPIKLLLDDKKDLQIDSKISVLNNPKSNLGKLKGYIENYGLALIRIKEALEAKSLVVGNQEIEVIKPSWWPIEAPKEKQINKSEELEVS